MNPIPTYIDCSETPLDWSSGLDWWNYYPYNGLVELWSNALVHCVEF